MIFLKWLLFSSFFIFLACGREFSQSMPGPKPPGPIVEELEGTDIGNGGDLIQCQRRGMQFPYLYEEGWYLLDYVELKGPKNGFLQKESLGGYLNHVRSLILKGAPEKIDSFDFFLSSSPFLDLESKSSDGLIQRAWISTDQNEEINDENPQYIPPNCRLAKSPRSLKLHQVVVRKEFVNEQGDLARVEYSFDEVLVKKIGDKPLQMSMLLVHEWLWDFYNSEEMSDRGHVLFPTSRSLRVSNRRLHSKQSSGLSVEEIRRALRL